MTSTQQPAEADVDALRRRLYRADATEEDVQRYLDLRGPEEAPLPQEPAPGLQTAVAGLLDHREGQRAKPKRSRRLIAGVAIAAVAVSAVTATTLLQQPAAPPARATPSAVPDARTVIQDIGGGEILRVDPTQAGGPAPLSVWIDGTAAAAQQFDGTGDAVLLVDLPSASTHRQTAVLSLYSTKPTSIKWRALRPATRPDWTPYEQIVARGTVAAIAQYAEPTTFDYSGSAPTKIALEVPAGTRWRLLITGIPSSIDELH